MKKAHAYVECGNTQAAMSCFQTSHDCAKLMMSHDSVAYHAMAMKHMDVCMNQLHSLSNGQRGYTARVCAIAPVQTQQLGFAPQSTAAAASTSSSTSTSTSSSSSSSSSSSTIRMCDIAGLAEAKQLLEEAVLTSRQQPQLFKNTKALSCILLYGPPGTGKTQLAKAIAGESQLNFIEVKSSDLVSRYQGESEKQIAEMFQKAIASEPCILFFDEFDSLARRRTTDESDTNRRIKTTLMLELTGVVDNHPGVCIIAATNAPAELDSAFLRRFEKRIYIPLPDEEARYCMIKSSMRDVVHDIPIGDFMILASESKGLSGSDIAQMMADAKRCPLRRLQSATSFRAFDGGFQPCASTASGAISKTFRDLQHGEARFDPVTLTDLRSALSQKKPSVDQAQLRLFEEWTLQHGIAGK